MKVKALIPARSGSQRVKNKNIRPFANSTLLEVKIKQLMRIPKLDGVVVNSDCDEILDMARSCGAEVVKRAEYFASSTVSINEVYENMAQNFDADIVVYSNCTNPLIEDSSIIGAIDMFLEGGGDSCNTGHYIKEFLWLDGKAMNYNPLQMPRSQDLPDIIALNFAVNVISRETMVHLKSIVGRHPLFYLISQEEATDIDNEIDFRFAEFVHKSRWQCNV